ncbi:MAG TPA: papain-like cysteine protease family protein [Candidatus Limnocylindrales bacterium]|nr:papain-like cysteine protease family protein [Candidatus Limnocylindrales bacterium]
MGSREDFAERYELHWDASIDFALERQIGLNWCWAAVAKGIVDHYGGPKRHQCQYATQFLKQEKTCCRKRVPEKRCDLEHDVDSVLAHYGNFAPPPFRRPIGLATIRRELERDRPVVALLRFPTGNHAVAITAIDVAHGMLRVCDPGRTPIRHEVHISELANAYMDKGTWFYTVLTRPAPGSVRRATVSYLHDHMRRPDLRVETSPVPPGRSATLDIDWYEIDPYRLAEGTGLNTAEFDHRRPCRLDVFATHNGALIIDKDLTKLRDEIWARLDRGFEVRIASCFAAKLFALWFTDPSDPSHRKDHYIPIPPLYYNFDETREYSAAETRQIFRDLAPVILNHVEHSRKLWERLDRETANQPDDPTI